MGDTQNTDTIRQIMGGFNSMQYSMGLLPMQQAQAMSGAGQQFQAPPPPPPMMSPGDAALQAMQRHESMVQQTLQAAQVTRYQPPPSAPTPSISAMVGLGAMNPFMAPPVGGGGNNSGGGGFGGGGGFAGAGAFAGGGFAGGGGAPRMPSVYNPFAPTMPQSHFASPAMRNAQIMQHHQAGAMAMGAGAIEMGMGLGGSAVGGALGSAFGPLGTMAGAYIGGKIGGAISGVMTGNVTQDYARGRQIQQMTSPFMVSGNYLNTATGQGMSASAARQTAVGIRELQRDRDFERTGFNTQDTMQIMNQSGQQGLLTGGQSPDQLVQKVKDISKTIKVLMKITGDPDVQSAIRSLGEMRDMGFQGLQAQGGAVANRATFARQAGISQAEAGQYGQMGAGMARDRGLAGATGYGAGMAGAAAANMAVSSGTLNDLQLSRAGGKEGVAGIMAKAQIAAMDDSRYLAASLTRDKQGRLSVDANLYKKAQGLSMDEVSRLAADKHRELGVAGNMELANRSQEFKDQIAQKLSPLDMQMMAFKQAQAKQQRIGHGADLAMGFRALGMSEVESRTMAKMGQSRSYWDAQIQQAEVTQRTTAADQDQAQRNQYRTPGAMTRIRRGVGDALDGVSDTLSSPFRSFSKYMDGVNAHHDAAERGELIDHYDDINIAHNSGEQRMLKAGLKNKTIREAYSRNVGKSILDYENEGDISGGAALRRSGSRQLNRVGAFFGLAADSNENRIVTIANQSEARYTSFGESFGDVGKAVARVRNVSVAGEAYEDAQAMGKGDAAAATRKLETLGRLDPNHAKFDAHAGLQAAAKVMQATLAEGRAGFLKSSDTMSGDKLEEAGIAAFTSQGYSPEKAKEMYAKDPKALNKLIIARVMATGTTADKEQVVKAADIKRQVGGIDFKRGREGTKDLITAARKMAGVDRLSTRSEISDGKYTGYQASNKSLSELKATFAADDLTRDEKTGNFTKRSNAVLQLVAALSADQGTPEGKAQAVEVIERLKGEWKDEFHDMYEEAQTKVGHMTTGESEVLRQTLNVGTSDKLSERIDALDLSFKAGMTGAADTAFQQKLSKSAGGDMGKIASAQTPEEAIRALSDAQMENIKKSDPAMYEKIKGRKPTQEVLDSLIADAAPQTGEERSGNVTGPAGRAAQQMTNNLRAMKSQMANGEDVSDAEIAVASADSSVVFQTSVKDFAESVTTLKQVISSPPFSTYGR